jgi:hypothetical protein
VTDRIWREIWPNNDAVGYACSYPAEVEGKWYHAIMAIGVDGKRLVHQILTNSRHAPGQPEPASEPVSVHPVPPPCWRSRAYLLEISRTT